jgi:chromosome segregation ATPase
MREPNSPARFLAICRLPNPPIQLELGIDQFHNLSMSEETTRDIPDSPSLAERVLARLNSMDEHLQSIDVRLQSVEVQAERRNLETKPIWERALSEILGVKTEVVGLKTEVVGVKAELGWVKAEIVDMKAALGGVKAEIVGMKDRLGVSEDLCRQILRKIDILNRDMLTMRADQLGFETRLDKLEPSNVS